MVLSEVTLYPFQTSRLAQVSTEVSDLTKRNAMKGQAVRTDDLMLKDQRFLISAFVYTPMNLTFEYQYEEAGAYEVSEL